MLWEGVQRAFWSLLGGFLEDDAEHFDLFAIRLLSSPERANLIHIGNAYLICVSNMHVGEAYQLRIPNMQVLYELVGVVTAVLSATTLCAA